MNQHDCHRSPPPQMLAVSLPVMLLCSGCLVAPRIHNEPLENPQPVTRMAEDGVLEMADGRRITPAGLRMRSTAETGEPDAMRFVTKLIGDAVDIESEDDGSGAAIWFRGEIEYNWTWPFFTPPSRLYKYERRFLNEWLIRAGLAEFDERVPGLDKWRSEDCRQADSEYRAALHEVRRGAVHNPRLDRFNWPNSRRDVRLARNDIRHVQGSSDTKESR